MAFSVRYLKINKLTGSIFLHSW